MKKYFLLLCLCSSLTVALAQTPHYDTIRYAREYYQERLGIFKNEPFAKGGIIFLGNSITEFGDWKKLLNDPTIVNRGIAGDNTYGILDRLDDVIKRQPRKLFLKVGINDLAQGIPVEIVVKNILTIVDQIKEKSPQTKILVQSVLPTNDLVKKEYPDAFGKNQLADQVNKAVQKAATKHAFTFVDITPLFKDKEGKLNAAFAESDGLHLNQQGYEVWAKFLKEKRYVD